VEKKRRKGSKRGVYAKKRVKRFWGRGGGGGGRFFGWKHERGGGSESQNFPFVIS